MALIRSKQINKVLEGNFSITGSIDVYGSATFEQTSSIYPAIIVSGSQVIVAADGNYSASFQIAGLGTFADTGSNAIIDLGDNSF